MPSPLRTGALAGLGAIALLAIVVAVARPHDPALAALVAALGALPAAGLGAFLARIGVELVEAPRWVRLMTLAPPAVALVVVLGFAAGMPALVAYALVPTALCVRAVERGTRARVAVPLAIARAA